MRDPFLPRLFLTPQISTPPTASAQNCKRGYLYTPQIKFGRILNNSRFCRLYGVFLRRRHSAFLPIAPISRRSARYQKLSNPPFPLFARSANYTRFLRLIFFPAQIRRLAKLHPFSHFSFVCKNQHFFAYRNFKGVFGFFIFAPIFQKQEFFCACQKSGSILTTQKEGGFFISSHQNSTLN